MDFQKIYQHTKEVLKANTKLSQNLQTLTDFIAQSFEVKVINIVEHKEKKDFLSAPEVTGLCLCVLNDQDENVFRLKNGQYDAKKLKTIETKYKEVANIDQNTNIVIVVQSFEPKAKSEINDLIPSQKIQDLKHQIGEDIIWEIVRAGGTAVFFVHTNHQLKQYSSSQEKKHWASQYFELLKEQEKNHFFIKVLQEKGFDIVVDSKENLDKNYEGNLYYYFK